MNEEILAFITKKTYGKTLGQLYVNKNCKDIALDIFNKLGYNANVSVSKGGTVGIKYLKKEDANEEL